MSKRARTTGTGDVHPQYLTLNTGIATAIDDYTVARVNLPVARIGGSKTKAVVLEVLAIDWYINIEDLNDSGNAKWAFLTTNTTRVTGTTSTLNTATADAADPLTLGFVISQVRFLTSGAGSSNLPFRIDMTDQEGNGVLIATDQIFIVGGSVANTQAGEVTAKVLYRLKEVGIQEYVGIVQSQQG